LTDTNSGSGSDTATVTITAQNDAPTLSNLDGDSFSYSEGDGAATLDQGTAVSVADVDSSDFNGGALTVTISAGEDAAEDVLSFSTRG
jgi:hypothetical protein